MASGLWSRYYRHQRRKEDRKRNPHKYLPRKKSSPSYYQRNKEKIRLYYAEMRAIALEIGNCSACFRSKEDPTKRTCERCRDYQKKYNLNRPKDLNSRSD